MEVRPLELFPAAQTVIEAYDKGQPSVVWTQQVADLETTVSAYLKLTGSQPYSFLLESVEGGATRGRYSFIGLHPDLIWKCDGNTAYVNRDPETDPTAFVQQDLPALDSLRNLLEESQIDLPGELPPMAAGLVGYMGFEMVRLMERLPEPKPDDIGTPDGMFSRPTLIAIFDSVKDVLTLVTPVRPVPGQTANEAYALAHQRLAQAVTDFEKPVPLGSQGTADYTTETPVTSTVGQEKYEAMVNTAKDYIAAGDIFQVVLSQRFSTPFDLPPFALYRSLRRTNPSPFLYFLQFEDFSVVGSSPEILVRVREGEVTIRPIAGTSPRGATPDQDLALEKDLLSDPKECAEHLMLLDLGRNDVGRVSEYGSVKVTDEFIIERYSHVMHIVSNVIGRLKSGYDVISAVAAGFPAGTVSGAPKVRAMEIIDELELTRRGIYAGCLGYFGAGGSVDTAIVLRTAIVKDNTMYVQAGAGVVADSDPASEHMECVNKSKALVHAAEEAVKFAQKRNF